MAQAQITYKRKTIDAFQVATKKLLEMGNSDLSNLRTRFEHIDRYIALESDRSADTARAKQLCLQGDKTVLRNFEPPIILGQVDSALAYFVEVFLSGYPIFGVVAHKKHEDLAAQMHALMARDSMRFGWARELTLAMGDGLKYNIGACEVDWVIKSSQSIGTEVTADSANTAKQTKVEYKGNAIKRIDPYNLILDPTVTPAECAEYGVYAGYWEIYNYIRVRRLLQQLNPEFKIVQNIGNALKLGQATSRNYFTPEIRMDLKSRSAGNETNWAAFFGNSTEAYKGNSTGQYELTTLYARLIPKEFDVVIPQSGTPTIFKFLLLNGELIYAEPTRVAHQLLPINCLQAYDEGQGMQTKSFCENLMAIQDIASSLQNGRLKALRRAVSDRGFYDPTRIRKQDIDSAQPDSKIPVKMNQYHKDLGSAYYAVPFRDEAGATINQEYGLVTGMASSATGVNQAMQGNFVRGNKTLSEYDDISNNAQARLRKMAVLWENQFFTPMKHMIRSNYLQFSMAEEVFDQGSGDTITVDPVKLREIETSFKISDGVLPSEKLINIQAMQFAIQGLQGIPELQGQYNVGAMYVTLIKAAGLPDLEDYKKTPEEMQAYAQQQAAMAGQAQPPAQ